MQLHHVAFELDEDARVGQLEEEFRGLELRLQKHPAKRLRNREHTLARLPEVVDRLRFGQHRGNVRHALHFGHPRHFEEVCLRGRFVAEGFQTCDHPVAQHGYDALVPHVFGPESNESVVVYRGFVMQFPHALYYGRTDGR